MSDAAAVNLEGFETCKNALDDFHNTPTLEGLKHAEKQLLTVILDIENNSTIRQSVKGMLSTYILLRLGSAFRYHLADSESISSSGRFQLEGANAKPDYFLSQVVFKALAWFHTFGKSYAEDIGFISTIDWLGEWNHHCTPKISLITWRSSSNPYVIEYNPNFYFPNLQYETQVIQVKLFSASSPRFLRHSASIKNFAKILTADLESKHLLLKGNAGNSDQYVCHDGGLVYTGLVLSQEELSTIKGKARDFVQENRYGSITMKFPIKLPPAGYILGTRLFFGEYAQAFLFDNRSENAAAGNPWCVQSSQHGIYSLAEIQGPELEQYVWKLQYNSANGDWTHPEILFPRELKIPIQDCEFSLIEKHGCIPSKQKQCGECNMKFLELKNRFERIISPLLSEKQLKLSVIQENENGMTFRLESEREGNFHTGMRNSDLADHDPPSEV